MKVLLVIPTYNCEDQIGRLLQKSTSTINREFNEVLIIDNEITDSCELPFFIQWLTADHPSQDGKAVAAIEKITIADTDHLSDSWFKTEILGGLNGADVEFVDPSANDGEYGIVAVQLTTPTRSVVLD